MPVPPQVDTNMVGKRPSQERSISQTTHFKKLNQVRIVELKQALSDYGVGFKANASKKTLFDTLTSAVLNHQFPSDADRRHAEVAASCIQSHWRGCKTRRLIRERGPGVVCRHLCNNLNDPVTQEPIEAENLSNELFVSMREHQSGPLFGFDIRSLAEMFHNEQKFNPFTRTPFTQLFVNNVLNLCNRLNNSSRKPSKKQSIMDRSFQLFHNCYLISGHMIDHNWFVDMSLRSLKAFYQTLHNYLFIRFNVQAQNVNNTFYNPTNPPFHRLNDIRNANRWKTQDMLLEELTYITTYPARPEDKQTVILWVIAALRAVSLQAYYGMQHLD